MTGEANADGAMATEYSVPELQATWSDLKVSARG
jgi:hypothetical protein